MIEELLVESGERAVFAGVLIHYDECEANKTKLCIIFCKFLAIFDLEQCLNISLAADLHVKRGLVSYVSI